MSRIIEIKGCRDCPFVDTSPYDCYCSFICMKNSEISWTAEEFLKLPMDYVDDRCLLEHKFQSK